MYGFRIRNARPADKAALGALWGEQMTLHHSLDARFNIAPGAEQLYARHAQELMRSQDGRVLVAEATDTEEVIGFLLGEIQARPPKASPGLYGFISDVYVREEWRQQGVASALFAEMRLWCLTRKAASIELYVAENNPTAIAFWQAMGLTPFLKLLRVDL